MPGTIEFVGNLSGTLSLQIVETTEGADYNKLENLPTINGTLVKGDLTQDDLNIKHGYDISVDPENDEHIIFTL